MNWILIAVASGMIMTSNHETEEACLGRKAILEKDKITNAKCISMQPIYGSITNEMILCANRNLNGKCMQ